MKQADHRTLCALSLAALLAGCDQGSQATSGSETPEQEQPPPEPAAAAAAPSESEEGDDAIVTPEDFEEQVEKTVTASTDLEQALDELEKEILQ